MDHDVKRVVAARVASIHVLLQQNYAAPGKQTYVSVSESSRHTTPGDMTAIQDT
jgi:hypothetical protein